MSSDIGRVLPHAQTMREVCRIDFPRMDVAGFESIEGSEGSSLTFPFFQVFQAFLRRPTLPQGYPLVLRGNAQLRPASLPVQQTSSSHRPPLPTTTTTTAWACQDTTTATATATATVRMKRTSQRVCNILCAVQGRPGFAWAGAQVVLWSQQPAVFVGCCWNGKWLDWWHAFRHRGMTVQNITT